MNSTGPRRPRVAVLVHGGLEAAGTGIDIPFLTGLLARAAKQIDLTIFTLRSARGTEKSPALTHARVVFVSDLPIRNPALRYAHLFASASAAHRRVPFDLFHGIWGHPGALAATALGAVLRRPVCASFHGAETANLPAIGYGHFRVPAARALLLRCAASSDAVTVLSRQQAGVLEARGLDPSRIHLIPPGVDTDMFSYHESATRRGDLSLLHVANLTPVKDQHTLIRATAQVTARIPASLRIVGADHLEGRLQAFADECLPAGCVSFLGHLPHEVLPGLYRSADIFVQSSLHEAGGVAVAEAAASGTMIVGTDTGLVRDLHPHAACAVTPGDPGALAEAILACAADTARAQGMRRAARAWAEHNSIDAAAAALLAVYETAISRQRSAM
ncbi:MAG: glycosyltransferase family 4 protein [Ignavibacteriae bacterium]|nr:glycosyltransferase family 4 protein [Ignavibacteriota bacterium]